MPFGLRFSSKLQSGAGGSVADREASLHVQDLQGRLQRIGDWDAADYPLIYLRPQSKPTCCTAGSGDNAETRMVLYSGASAWATLRDRTLADAREAGATVFLHDPTAPAESSLYRDVFESCRQACDNIQSGDALMFAFPNAFKSDGHNVACDKLSVETFAYEPMVTERAFSSLMDALSGRFQQLHVPLSDIGRDTRSVDFAACLDHFLPKFVRAARELSDAHGRFTLRDDNGRTTKVDLRIVDPDTAHKLRETYQTGLPGFSWSCDPQSCKECSECSRRRTFMSVDDSLRCG